MPKYIDGDALLEEAKRISGPMTGDGWDNWGVYDLIKRQPAADVRPVVHGYWIDERSPRGYGMTTRCSACGQRSGIGGIESNRHKPFCPNCGADMTGIKPALQCIPCRPTSPECDACQFKEEDQ